MLNSYLIEICDGFETVNGYCNSVRQIVKLASTLKTQKHWTVVVNQIRTNELKIWNVGYGLISIGAK